MAGVLEEATADPEHPPVGRQAAGGVVQIALGDAHRAGGRADRQRLGAGRLQPLGAVLVTPSSSIGNWLVVMPDPQVWFMRNTAAAADRCFESR